MTKEELLQEVKTTPISFFISKYIEIIGKSPQFQGLCPFHKDSHPSLQINDHKQIFKCFSCGEAGDVITFIQKYKNISFIESLKEAGSFLGISLEETVFLSPYFKELEKISDFYHEVGKSDSNFQSFCKKRNLHQKTIDYFHMGSSSKKIPWTSSELEELGYINSYGNFFRNRFMIPIRSRSHTIGFTARSYSDEKPKYINSKDSKLFKKKEILFHFDEAKKQKDFIILVEGHLDVASLYQKGYWQSCALMGLSFEEHLITKFSQFQTIYFALDNDVAGKNFSIKLNNFFLKEKILVKILQPEPYKDLDEYLQKHESLETLLEKAPLFLDLILKKHLIDIPLSLEKKISIFESISKILQPLGFSPFSLEKLLETRDTLKLQMSDDNVKNFYLEKDKKKYTSLYVDSHQTQKKEDFPLFDIFLTHLDLLEEDLSFFYEEISLELREVLQKMQYFYKELGFQYFRETLYNDIDKFDFSEKWRNFILKTIITKGNLTLDEKNRKKLLKDLIFNMKEKKLSFRRASIIENLDSMNDLSEIQAINQEIKDLHKEKL